MGHKAKDKGLKRAPQRRLRYPSATTTRTQSASVLRSLYRALVSTARPSKPATDNRTQAREDKKGCGTPSGPSAPCPQRPTHVNTCFDYSNHAHHPDDISIATEWATKQPDSTSAPTSQFTSTVNVYIYIYIHLFLSFLLFLLMYTLLYSFKHVYA